MTNATINTFPGFYESALDDDQTRALESIFDIDDSGCNNAIPNELDIDYAPIREAQARAYADAWVSQYEDTTGIKLQATYESMQSPKYYNFETDRLFITLSPLSIAELFTASEADNHKQLEQVIKSSFTSRDGFISSYSDELNIWLSSPVATWDHNELGALVDAVLLIHATPKELKLDFAPWHIMENFNCNGGLTSAFDKAIPQEFFTFAELQREHEKALDFAVWRETGVAWDPESGEPCPPLRCNQTLELPLGGAYAA
jgi:hypothetical protein